MPYLDACALPFTKAFQPILHIFAPLVTFAHNMVLLKCRFYEVSAVKMTAEQNFNRRERQELVYF